MRPMILAAAAILFGCGPALAQSQHQPYAGLEVRAIKSLSDQQIADLRAGRGMGLALPAELNGYPGPIHVLELGDQLALSPEQRTRMEALVAEMRAEAIPLGEKLIEQEAALNRAFAERRITPAGLKAATAEIGSTQGALRAAHLRFHLLTLDALTPHQAARYSALRGYAAGGASHHTHRPH